MGVRRVIRDLRVALLVLAAGCHSPVEPAPAQADRPAIASTAGAFARAAAPSDSPAAGRAPPSLALPLSAPKVILTKEPSEPLSTAKAAEALTSTSPPPVPTLAAESLEQIPAPDDRGPGWVATSALQTIGGAGPRLRPPLLIREEAPLTPNNLPPVTEPPGSLVVVPTAAEPPVAPAKPVSPGDFLPPIPAVPDGLPAAQPVPPPSAAPAIPPPPRTSDSPPALLPPPSALPPSALPPLSGGPKGPLIAGPIELDGNPIPFDALSKMVDGNSCSHCGGPLAAGGCPTCGGSGGCGDPQCRAGGRRCEPFPAETACGRVLGAIYSTVCCPDPCYQPHWEPLIDSAFFVDTVYPITSTRFRWDYGNHFAHPDRGEFFYARADGKGRGPAAYPAYGLKAIPSVNYNELMLVNEAATGPASVQIAVPYRSVDARPFGPGGAGFGDMNITAKTMLLSSELALFGFQFRTYIPIGNAGKGVGTGHVSLEPALNFGLRLAPETYLQWQVKEWIPIGGNTDYMGANLQWGVSLNHVLWRPIKDVQLIGTLETTGISFQDGLFTDPAVGSVRLTKQTSATIGPGLRLFFCNTLDVGLGWQHGITGNYLMRDQTRFEIRYRY